MGGCLAVETAPDRPVAARPPTWGAARRPLTAPHRPDILPYTTHYFTGEDQGEYAPKWRPESRGQVEARYVRGRGMGLGAAN